MQATDTARTLTRNDTRLVTRDSFLLMMTFYSLVVAVLFRYLVPWLTNRLLASSGYDLTPFYPVLTGWLMVSVGPQIAGAVFGYLLLEEKEAETLRALMVTPLSLESFLTYRVIVSAVFGFLIALATILITDLVHLPFYQMVLISAVAGLYAPITMLFYATAASNTVEAFALLKITGILSVIPIAAWFLSEPWQFLAGIFPPYWATKSLWEAAANGSNWWLYLAIGAVESVAVIWWLIRRFETLAHK